MIARRVTKANGSQLFNLIYYLFFHTIFSIVKPIQNNTRSLLTTFNLEEFLELDLNQCTMQCFVLSRTQDQSSI